MSTNNAANFGTGTAGQVLTSNGAGVAPTFQAAATGTVTSVATSGLAAGGPITTTGTITVTAATTGDMQTGTSTTTAVIPNVMQNSQTATKAWVICNTGGTISLSYNTTSVTHVGTGVYTVNWAVTFASANQWNGTGSDGICISSDGGATTTASVKSRDLANNLADSNLQICTHGTY